MSALAAWALLHEHGGAGDAEGGSRTWDLCADHVVLGPAAAGISLAVLAGAEIDALGPELTLVCADERRPSLSLPTRRASTELLAASRRAGAHFLRPGCGGHDAVYRERFAAPGKLMLVSGEGVSSAGAYGVLALATGSLEAAEILRSGRVQRDVASVMHVRLHGSLAPWLSGTDVALELGRRLYPGGAGGRVVEFGGAGVATLSMADRVALAARSRMLAAAAILFGADDVTRAGLEALGRGPDWSRMELAEGPGDEEGVELDLDLDTLEPRMSAVHTAGMSRRVRQAGGFRIDRVTIGPQATYADLARMAAVIEPRAVHADTEMVIVPGSVAILETAARTGVLETLRKGGVRIEHDWMTRGPRHPASLNGLELFFGGAVVGSVQSNRWLASPETCAASACGGRLSDPRETDLAFRRHLEPERYVVDSQWIVKPVPASEPSSNGHGVLRVAPGVALDRPLRGSVLLSLDRHPGGARVLPSGARVLRSMARFEHLARHAFRDQDPGFADRAHRHGGGFVVAGSDLGAHERGDVAALVLRELGVRVVFARAFVPSFQRLLVQVGLLPLVLPSDREAASLEQGDELELPGLPEALEPGTPVVVRNLTRGTQITTPHMLGDLEIAQVCAGGLLEYGRARARMENGR